MKTHTNATNVVSDKTSAVSRRRHTDQKRIEQGKYNAPLAVHNPVSLTIY